MAKKLINFLQDGGTREEFRELLKTSKETPFAQDYSKQGIVEKRMEILINWYLEDQLKEHIVNCAEELAYEDGYPEWQLIAEEFEPLDCKRIDIRDLIDILHKHLDKHDFYQFVKNEICTFLYIPTWWKKETNMKD